MPKPDDRSNQARVPGLDLLRLAAVSAVVLYHYGFWGPSSNGVPQVALPYLASFGQYGFLGVPVFFTISGFVIAIPPKAELPSGSQSPASAASIRPSCSA